MAARLRRLETEARGRLLVVGAHVPQRINAPDGPRLMNAYLGPIVDRLQGRRLDPIDLDLRADLANDEHWRRLNGPRAERKLSGYVLTLEEGGFSAGSARALAKHLAAEIAADTTPVEVDGVDLGPALRRVVSQRVGSGMPRRACARLPRSARCCDGSGPPGSSWRTSTTARTGSPQRRSSPCRSRRSSMG